MAGSIYDRMMGTPQYDSNAGTSAMNAAASAFQGMASTFNTMRQSIIDEEQKNLQREMEKQHHQEEMAYKDKALSQDDRHHTEQLEYNRWAKQGDWAIDREKMAQADRHFQASLAARGSGRGGRGKGSGEGDGSGITFGNPYLDRYVRPGAGVGKKGGDKSKEEYRRIATGQAVLPSRFSESNGGNVNPNQGDAVPVSSKSAGSTVIKGIDTSKIKGNSEDLGIATQEPKPKRMASSVYQLQSLSDPVPNLLLEQRYTDQGRGPKETAFDYEASQRDFDLQGIRGTGVQTGRAMQLQRDVPSTRYEAIKAGTANAVKAQLEAEQRELLARRDFYNKAEADYDLPKRYAFNEDSRNQYNQALLDWSEDKKLPENKGLLTPAEEAYQDMDKAYKAYQKDQQHKAEVEQQRKLLEDMKAKEQGSPYSAYQNALNQFQSHIPSDFEIASYDKDNPRATQLGVDLQNLSEAAKELYGTSYDMKQGVTKQRDAQLSDWAQGINDKVAITQNINSALNRADVPADSLVFNDTYSPVVSDGDIDIKDIGFGSSKGINAKLLSTYDGTNFTMSEADFINIGDRNPRFMNDLITTFVGLPGKPKSPEEIEKAAIHKFGNLVNKSPETRAQAIVMYHGLAERIGPSTAQEGLLAVAKGLALSLNSGYDKTDPNHRNLLRGKVKQFLGMEPSTEEREAGTKIEAAKRANEYNEGYIPKNLKRDDYVKYVTGYDKLVPAAQADIRDLIEDLPRKHNIAREFVRAEIAHDKEKGGKGRAPDTAVLNMRTAILSTALELWGEWYLDHHKKGEGPTDADVRAFTNYINTPNSSWYKRLEEGTAKKLERLSDRRPL